MSEALPADPLQKVFLEVEVLAASRIAPDGYRLSLSAPPIARTIRPGQFVNLYVRSVEPSVLLPRPFSVYDYEPERGTLDVVFNTVGPGTRALARLERGARIPIAGPLGNGFSRDERCRRLICVAGGIGVTPFLALLRRWEAAEALLLFGARTSDRLYAWEDFERLGVEVRLATDDGSAGHKGFVTDLLEEEMTRPGEGLRLAACGPRSMLRAVCRLANARRIPCQVSMESHMPCGLGACRGCAWPVRAGGEKSHAYTLLCTEGPILWAHEILWPANT